MWYSSLCEAAIYLCPSVPILKAVSLKHESPISVCIIEHQATGEVCTAVGPLSMRTHKLPPCFKLQIVAKHMVVVVAAMLLRRYSAFILHFLSVENDGHIQWALDSCGGFIPGTPTNTAIHRYWKSQITLTDAPSEPNWIRSGRSSEVNCLQPLRATEWPFRLKRMQLPVSFMKLEMTFSGLISRGVENAYKTENTTFWGLK